MAARYEMCGLKGGVSAHFVKGHLTTVPAGVHTYCGRMGMPSPLPTLPRTCHDCLVAVNDEINGVKTK